MTQNKKNCWEFMKCGREPEGENIKALGICPASTFQKMDGFHGGKNGGRVCWFIAMTICHGVLMGSYAKKINDCLDCIFYSTVKKEENEEFYNSLEQDNKKIINN